MSLFSGENPNLGLFAGVNGSLINADSTVHLYLTATSATQTVFVVPTTSTSTYQLASVTAVFGTASSSGTLQVETIPSGTANGSGSNQLTTAVALSGTANTPVTAVPTAANTKVIKAGGRIGIVLGGTLTGLANCTVRVSIKRLT